MFTLDDRVRGLPAQREQVVALHQSINAPHVAIPGKQAGPAQAFILSVRGNAGFNVFIYLHLADAGDCAVYLADRRNLSAAAYPEQEAEAFSFVESMGFIMDNVNFRGAPVATQEALLKTLAVFQKAPPRTPRSDMTPSKSEKPAGDLSLARLFAAF
ncbi:MAG: social motility and stimulation tgl protein [Myxococcaceae bacterium]